MLDWLDALCRIPAIADTDPAKAIELADLSAQQEMACWAQFAFGATLLSVILSGLALAALFWSLRQTSKSISHTRQLGHAQTRSYVHASGAEHLWTNSGGPYTVLLHVENVGQTPAKVFEVGGTLQKVRMGEVGASIKKRDYPMKAWSALGPGVKPTTVRLDLQDFSELAREFTNLVPDHYILLTGTVRYLDVFDQWFETDFAYFSYTTTPNGNEAHTKLRRPTARIRSYEPVKHR